MKVCVFAGAHGCPELMPDAEWFGAELAKRGHHVYFGASTKGVMGALARGVISQGGQLTGVLPESIKALRHYNPSLDLVTTPDMASRKAVFWECDAFLCLPGSYGSMDELFEILTHVKLGHEQSRPIVVYNQRMSDGHGFYDGLDRLIQDMVKYGTMTQERAGLVRKVSERMEALNALEPVACQDTTDQGPESGLAGSGE
jgi:uncharacterized protein (TIGR00730 family)